MDWRRKQLLMQAAFALALACAVVAAVVNG